MADSVNNIRINIQGKDNSGTMFEGLEKNLRSLKSQFGRRGIFGELGELLVGGGIVGGITLLAEHIKKASEHSLELRKNMEAGQTGVGDFISELARSVPVLGQIVSMWDALREAIFTSGEELRKQRIESQQEDNRGIRQKLQETRDKDRIKTFQGIETAGKAAGESRLLIGLDPDAQKQMQALLDRSHAMDIANEMTRQVQTLAPEQQPVARAAIDQIKAAAEEKYQDALWQVTIKQREDRDKKQAEDQKARGEAESERLKEVERGMKERRRDEQERTKEKLRAEDELRKNTARPTGIFTDTGAGALTGVSERAARGDDPALRSLQKQESYQDRMAKSLDRIAAAVTGGGTAQPIL